MSINVGGLAVFPPPHIAPSKLHTVGYRAGAVGSVDVHANTSELINCAEVWLFAVRGRAW